MRHPLRLRVARRPTCFSLAFVRYSQAMTSWVLDSPMMIGEWAFADVIDPVYGGAPKCPSCGRFLGMLEWLPPYRIRLVKGTKSYIPGDLIDGPGAELMASQRFIAQFERAKLKGVERWEPVTIEGYNNYWEKKLKRPAPAEPYMGPIFPPPTVRAKWEKMHPVADGDMEWTGCEVCGRSPRNFDSWKGVVVDEDSWTGADIFQLTSLGSRFIVTEAFANFVAEGNFRGVPLVPAAQDKPFRAPPATW